jgi:hypothetical protein
MKLDQSQLQQVSEQVGLDPVPDSDPAQYYLETHFGTHTFYLDRNGLYVWEAVAEDDGSAAHIEAMKIAEWADEQRSLLEAHPPQRVGTTMLLNPIN